MTEQGRTPRAGLMLLPSAQGCPYSFPPEAAQHQSGNFPRVGFIHGS